MPKSTKRSKEPTTETATAEQLAPIKFDADDERSIEAVREALWLRPGKRYVIDVIIQCLRLATEAVENAPGIAKRFKRESPGISVSGRVRSFRLLPNEREALDRLRAVCDCGNSAEAMRLAVRIAEHVAVKTRRESS